MKYLNYLSISASSKFYSILNNFIKLTDIFNIFIFDNK